jgi:branched-chain amino acid transport system ATP-binding protein
MALLTVENLTKSFGGLLAVQDFSMDVIHGEIHSLVGPNGAGKTTVFNLVSGVLMPDIGRIIFNGEDITALSLRHIIGRGIMRTFQLPRIINELTVLENASLGCYLHGKSSMPLAALGAPRVYREEALLAKKAMECLEFVQLDSLHNADGAILPHGSLKMLEIARGLASEPKLILLDEVAAGLNTAETEELMRMILKIRESGITVFLIEHDMRMVMSISDRITVMDNGRIIAKGTPSDIRENELVVKAYLGGDSKDA